MPRTLALDDVGTGEPLVLLHGIATDRHIGPFDLVEYSLGVAPTPVAGGADEPLLRAA